MFYPWRRELLSNLYPGLAGALKARYCVQCWFSSPLSENCCTVPPWSVTSRSLVLDVGEIRAQSHDCACVHVRIPSNTWVRSFLKVPGCHEIPNLVIWIPSPSFHEKQKFLIFFNIYILALIFCWQKAQLWQYVANPCRILELAIYSGTFPFLILLVIHW